MSNSCYRGGKKHDFKPRYDEVDSNRNIKMQIQSEASPEELTKMLVLRKYVGEVCTWCGRTRPRKRIESSKE